MVYVRNEYIEYILQTKQDIPLGCVFQKDKMQFSSVRKKFISSLILFLFSHANFFPMQFFPQNSAYQSDVYGHFL